MAKRKFTREQRFWAKVRKTDNCWIWTAGRHAFGYGSFDVADGKNSNAHRYSYALHKGPIPAGLDVLHKCDNPPCVNPDHLFLGTDQDNSDDKRAKGRDWHPKTPGELNGYAKLTADDVLAIRKSVSNNTQTGRRYGVSRSAVYLIRARKRWSHI